MMRRCDGSRRERDVDHGDAQVRSIQFTVSGGPAILRTGSRFAGLGARRPATWQWKYLNGDQDGRRPPGSSSATLHIHRAARRPGTYNIRFFANMPANKLATSATITVGTQPSQPTLTINDVDVTEGNSGTSASATFTVTLSPVNASQTVTVDYATANGTATRDNDYVAVQRDVDLCAVESARRRSAVTGQWRHGGRAERDVRRQPLGCRPMR